LFPVGLNASRNAVAESCSSDVVDQLITYFRVVNEVGNKYSTNFTNTGYLDEADVPTDPGNTPTDTEIMDHSAQFLKDYSDGKIVAGSGDDYERLSSGWAIFKTPITGMFFVVQGPNCLEDTGERSIDFSAMALVWKSPVQIKRWDGSAWGKWPLDSVVTSALLSTKYQYSGKLNIELSWPLDLPYADRKKRYYQIVINNPN
jgi:hypothetical protein